MDIRLHEVVRIVLEVLSLFFQEALGLEISKFPLFIVSSQSQIFKVLWYVFVCLHEVTVIILEA